MLFLSTNSLESVFKHAQGLLRATKNLSPRPVFSPGCCGARPRAHPPGPMRRPAARVAVPELRRPGHGRGLPGTRRTFSEAESCASRCPLHRPVFACLSYSFSWTFISNRSCPEQHSLPSPLQRFLRSFTGISTWNSYGLQCKRSPLNNDSANAQTQAPPAVGHSEFAQKALHGPSLPTLRQPAAFPQEARGLGDESQGAVKIQGLAFFLNGF